MGLLLAEGVFTDVDQRSVFIALVLEDSIRLDLVCEISIQLVEIGWLAFESVFLAFTGPMFARHTVDLLQSSATR